MFANKQNQTLQKIKCIITGQMKQCRVWYNCGRCFINYNPDVFKEYDGYLLRPRCAMCDFELSKKTVQLFAPHRRR